MEIDQLGQVEGNRYNFNQLSLRNFNFDYKRLESDENKSHLLERIYIKLPDANLYHFEKLYHL